MSISTFQIQKTEQLTGHNASIFALAPADAAGERWYSGAGEGWVVEWNFETPDPGKLAAKVETQIFSLLTVVENEWVAVGNMNGGVHWVNLKNPEATKNIAHHDRGVFAFAKYENALFSCGGEGMLTRWSIERQSAVESIHLSNRSLRCIALHPSEPILAVGASDGAIYLLDRDTFEVLRHWQAHEPSVFALNFLGDGTTLISGGRDAHFRVWETATGAPLHASPAHLYTINDIVSSPCGKWFATGSRDKTIKIWNAKTYELVKVLEMIRDEGHLNSVNALLWAKNGTLVSAGDDRSIILWETNAG